MSADEFNAKGYFEHDHIWRLHHELLRTMGLGWQDFRSLPHDGFDREEACRIRMQLVEILREDFSGTRLWGIKDPRLSRMLPLWARISKEFPFIPHELLVIRHPLEVAASLIRRDGLEIGHALMLWLRYTLDAERDSRGMGPRLVLDYVNLLDDWRSQIGRINEAWSLGLAVTGDAAKKVDAFLDRSLRHDTVPSIHNSVPQLTNWVLEVWSAMVRGEPNTDTLDEIDHAIYALEVQATPYVQAITWSSGTVERLDQDKNYLEAELGRRQEQIESLDQELTGLKHSRSWKITRPMRDVAWLLRDTKYKWVGGMPARDGVAHFEPQTIADLIDKSKPSDAKRVMSSQTEGMRKHQSDPGTKSGNKRILIVSPDWVGPIRNGGIGTAFTNLARHLAARGWEVTGLYTLGDHTESGLIDQWVEYYRQWGICFIPLPKWVGPVLDATWYRARSYEVYQWLAAHEFEFDLVIWTEWSAIPYYSLWAKRSGLSFLHLPMIVIIHSPTAWAHAGNYWLPANQDEVDLHEMEPVCVELADHVVSPSRYMIDWMMSRNWPLPPSDRVHVMRNLMPPDDEVNQNLLQTSVVDGYEWVFFGRLEPRKGLDLFTTALDRLPQEAWKPIEKITFLGKEVETSEFSTCAYFADRQAQWPRPVQLITNLDSQAALDYLQQPRRMAIIASLLENSPFTVLECLQRNIPFVATATGGIAELIAADDRDRVLFAPRPADLARKLMTTTQWKPAKAAVGDAVAVDQWMEILHSCVVEGESVQSQESCSDKEANPRVSICLVHYQRPLLLAQALASLRAQDYDNFEVILIDDGSADSETEAFLMGLQEDFKLRNWKLIRQENSYLGAARNTAARAASGEYLLFMDDDNVAHLDEIRLFIQSALMNNADIVTCPSAIFTGPKVPHTEQPETIWLIGSRAGSRLHS